MNNSGRFTQGNTDRWLVALALIALLFILPLLFSDDINKRLFGHDEGRRPIVGEIVVAKNDTRKRGSDSATWEPATSKENVRLGDSLFSGEGSLSTVTMQQGGSIDVEQNSLVRFVTIETLNLASLKNGNFRLVVNGTMKIAIGDEVTEIKGNSSTLRVTIKENQNPTMRLLSGEATVKTAKGEIRLQRNQNTVLNEGRKQPPQLNPPPLPPTPPANLNPPLLPNAIAEHRASSVVHTQKLYDVYDKRGDGLRLRQEPRTLIQEPVPVTWTLTGAPTAVLGEFSDTPDFLSVHDSFKADAQAKRAEFSKALIGANYYRLSVDGKNWSNPESVQVDSLPLNTPPPRIVLDSKKSSYRRHDLKFDPAISRGSQIYKVCRGCLLVRRLCRSRNALPYGLRMENSGL